MNIDIQQNIPLAPLTTFKIGGLAKFFVEVSMEEELIEAINYARDNNLATFIIGGGSNILVSDEGFDGLVVKLKTKSDPPTGEAGKLKVTEQDSKFILECWAGNSLSNVVNFCKENSLTGFEWAVGIPGTVGGAVRGNAGAYGSEIKNSIESLKVLEMSKDELRIMNYEAEKCNFAYRDSIFKQNKNLVIISCILKLEKGDKIEIEAKMRDIIAKRTEKIPRDPSPGSLFQNPETDDADLIRQFEADTGKKVTDHVSYYQYAGNKIKIPASWLIEKAGLKGKKIGGVVVSEKHANFVVNLGEGKAQEVIMLMSFIKMKIRDEFGIQLKEEVQLVGF